jgi:hypothetical protein
VNNEYVCENAPETATTQSLSVIIRQGQRKKDTTKLLETRKTQLYNQLV